MSKDHQDPYVKRYSDLEWMLQSGQVGDGVVLDALLDAFYEPVYRLSWILTGEQAAADRAVQRTFREALLQMHAYSGQGGVRLWLFYLALEYAQKESRRGPARRPHSVPQTGTKPVREAMLSLETPQRLAISLHLLDRFSPSEISALLKKKHTTVAAWLSSAQARLTLASKKAGILIGDSPEPERFNALEQALLEYYPVPDLKPADRSRLSSLILEQAAAGGRRLRRVTAVQEFLLILVALFGVLLLVGGTNLLLPAAEITPTPKRTVLITELVRVRVTATPKPSRSIDQSGSAYPAGSVFTTARENDTLEKIAERFRLNPDDLARLNRLAADAALEAGRLVVIRVLDEPTVTPSRRTPQNTGPLPADANEEDVRLFIQENSLRWRTLWLDGQVINYGPPGYVGQPEVRRDQVWVVQSNYSLVLSGPRSKEPDRIWYAIGNKVYDVDLPSGRPVLYDFHVDGSLPVYSTLNELIDPVTWLPSGFRFKISGTDTVAGREALVIDGVGFPEQPQVILWVDRETGLLLRLQEYYSADSHDWLLRELILHNVLVDSRIPETIFDRNRILMHFAEDITGSPESNEPAVLRTPVAGHPALDRISPPEDLDLARAELTFQWAEPPLFNLFQSQWGARIPTTPDHYRVNIPVDVFANEYYLGQVNMNPWSAYCARSPDGRGIAVLSDQSSFTDIQDLTWFRLDNLGEAKQTPLRFVGSHNLAFAPDSRRLALSGCTSDRMCGGFILDTETGKYDLVFLLETPGQLEWSEDGQYLALIGSVDGEDHIILVVVDAADGKMLWRTSLDSVDDIPPSTFEALRRDWQIQLPQENVPQGGLPACQAPPDEE